VTANPDRLPDEDDAYVYGYTLRQHPPPVSLKTCWPLVLLFLAVSLVCGIWWWVRTNWSLLDNRGSPDPAYLEVPLEFQFLVSAVVGAAVGACVTAAALTVRYAYKLLNRIPSQC
jgi:hypothetical protein